jgi:hypothetical protein
VNARIRFYFHVYDGAVRFGEFEVTVDDLFVVSAVLLNSRIVFIAEVFGHFVFVLHESIVVLLE